MEAPDPADREADARWRFGLFAVLLAFALLLHQLWWNGFEVTGLHAAVILAAFAVLLWPTSVRLVLVLLGLEVASVWAAMPGAGSHTLLVGVCGATILAHVGWTAVRTRRLLKPGPLFEQVAPFLRASVLVLYAAAALAKLNSGFFDASVSCGAAMAPSVAWFAPWLLGGAWLAVPAIYGTVLVEAALPVLLGLRRTRSVGLVLGVGFHLVLAFAGNVPFSSLLLALYVAFLPAGALGRVRAVVAVPRAPGWTRPAALGLLVAAWGAGALAGQDAPAATEAAIGHATRIAVLVLVLAAAAAALAVRRTRPWPAATPTPGPRLGRPVLMAGVAVLVLNALTPYVGLKTESSFAMYSNLQTEGDAWNHLLVPEAVRVFGHQDRLVTVTASNDPGLRRRTRNGTRMVRFELERQLRRNPGTWARATPTAKGGPGWSTPLVDKVAKFRDVRAAGRRGC